MECSSNQSDLSAFLSIGGKSIKKFLSILTYDKPKSYIGTLKKVF
jgi:hypothetical protein